MPRAKVKTTHDEVPKSRRTTRRTAGRRQEEEEEEDIVFDAIPTRTRAAGGRKTTRGEKKNKEAGAGLLVAGVLAGGLAGWAVGRAITSDHVEYVRQLEAENARLRAARSGGSLHRTRANPEGYCNECVAAGRC